MPLRYVLCIYMMMRLSKVPDNVSPVPVFDHLFNQYRKLVFRFFFRLWWCIHSAQITYHQPHPSPKKYNSIPMPPYSQATIDNSEAQTTVNLSPSNSHTLKFINCINGQIFQLFNNVDVLPLTSLRAWGFTKFYSILL